MLVHFTGAESTFSYFEATRAYLERYGKPLALYSDKASIFRVNRDTAGGPGYTQFARALYELNIDGICANTPASDCPAPEASIGDEKEPESGHFYLAWE